MSPTITAIRAIGTEFAKRLLVPIAVISALILALMIIGVMLLASLSQWWLLLLIPVVILLCVTLGVLVIMWLVVSTVRPVQTKAQHVAVKAFVDKLQRLSDAIQTPKVVLLFRIVRDVAAPRKDGFIASMTDDTASLKRDFQELRKLFQ